MCQYGLQAVLCAAGRGGGEGVTNSSQKWIFCRKTKLALGLCEQQQVLFFYAHYQ